MKTILVLLALLAVCLASSLRQGAETSNFSAIKTEKDRYKWKLIFQDEFEGKEVDSKKWNVASNFTHTEKEQQIYFPENAYVENGNLVIKTEYSPKYYAPTNRTYHYTSAWLDTKQKFNFTSGSRVEAKILLPKTKMGDQIWPALWTKGEQAPWPSGGEIDIMEMSTNWFSDKLPHLYGTYHWGVDGVDYCGGCGTIFPDFSLNLEDYIVFAVDWEETSIKWYINDMLYRTTEQDVIYNNTDYQKPVELPKFPQFLILNDAIDGFSEPNHQDYPKYMKVDYVRVYQLQPVSQTI